MRGRTSGKRAGFLTAGLVFIVLCLGVTLFPQTAHADNQGKLLSPDVYKTLGLEVTDDMPENTQDLAPFDASAADAPTSLLTESEIYVAANGPHGNNYTLRNRLNKLNHNYSTDITYLNGHPYYDDDYTEANDAYGALRGAYPFYAINGEDLPDEIAGGGTESPLSDNSHDVIKGATSEGFSGKYATSVECDTGSGYDDHVVELRAYGDNYQTKVGDATYTGAVELKLCKIDASGNRTEEETFTPHANANQTHNGRFKYLDAGYLQENDALFEVVAGDVDNDGIDEIFSYSGAYEDNGDTRFAIVDMWKRDASTGAWNHSSRSVSAGPSSAYATDAELQASISDNKKDKWEWQLLKQSPVVTMATGNLDRHAGEELAVTVSAPGDNDAADQIAACFVCTWDAQTHKLRGIDALNEEVGSDFIPLSSSDGTSALASASCAFGTFRVGASDYTAEGLIIAGYDAGKNRTNIDKNFRYSNAGYRFVYYDAQADQFVVTNFQRKSLGTDGMHIVDTAVNDASKDCRYTPTLAPFALSCARLHGLYQGVENDSVLFGGEVYDFTLSREGGLSSEKIGSLSITSQQHNHNDNNKEKEQVWIGDVRAGAVSGDDAYRESFLAVVGVHRDEECRGDDDYYWMDVSHFTANYSGDSFASYESAQEGVVCEGNRVGSRYGTWISLSLPDVNHDTLQLRFKDATKYYTSPQVLAVLEDAPYFQDLEDAYHYNVLGGTEFMKSASAGSGGKWGIEGEAGAYLSAEGGILAHGEFRVELKAHMGYESQTASKLEYGVSYESHAGEGNKVVVYSVPMLYYYYQASNPGSDTWTDVVIPVYLEPMTSMVSSEVWDEVAGQVNMPKVGDILTNVSGDPSTYTGAAMSNIEGSVLAYEHGSVQHAGPSAGGTTTDIIAEETEDEQSLSGGASIGYEEGGGFKIFGNEAIAGYCLEASGGFSYITSNARGFEFAGSVDNLPNDAEGYGFDWQLRVNKSSNWDPTDKDEFKQTDNQYWIIGFEASNIARPEARVVSGLSVEGVTDHSVTLTFDDTLAGTDYNYGIAMVDANGALSDFHVVRQGAGTTYTWGSEDDPLDSGHTYRFVIQPVLGATDKTAKAQGVHSAVVAATTLPAGCSMDVEGANIQAPGATDDLTHRIARRAVGDSVVLTVTGSYAQTKTDSAGAETTDYREPKFIWERKGDTDTEWERIGVGLNVVYGAETEGAAAVGASAENTSDVRDGQEYYTSTLTIASVKAEDDNSKYRCRVGYNDTDVESHIVTLDATHTIVTADPDDQATSYKQRRAYMRPGLLRAAFEPVVPDAVVSQAAVVRSDIDPATDPVARPGADGSASAPQAGDVSAGASEPAAGVAPAAEEKVVVLLTTEPVRTGSATPRTADDFPAAVVVVVAAGAAIVARISWRRVLRR